MSSTVPKVPTQGSHNFLDHPQRPVSEETNPGNSQEATNEDPLSRLLFTSDLPLII